MALNRVVTTEGGFFAAIKKFFGFVGDGAENRARMFEQFEKNLEGIKKQYQAIADVTDVVVTGDRDLGGAKTDLNKIIEEQKEKARQLRDIFAKTRSPVDQLSDALWQAEDALKNLGISEQQYFTLVEQANEAYENSINRTERGKTALQEYAEAAQNVAVSLDTYAVDALKGLEDTMTGLIMGTIKTRDAFKSMAASIIADLTRIVIQRSITGPLAELLFSSLPGFGGTGGGAAPPGRAIGGPVQSGSPYMVGERGAELFVPNTSGTIVPSNKLGAGGVTINQTLNIDASADRAGIQRALELNRRQTISEINDLMRRNSPALARM